MKRIHVHIHGGLDALLPRAPARDELVQGKSDAARSENIATEVRAGKDPKQAAAIAYAVQRRAGTGDDQGRDPDGKFAAGGAGHALRSHPNNERARADVKERHEGLQAHGFAHEKTERDHMGSLNDHYSHPDGSRAVIMHKRHELTGRHQVSSVVNTMNQGKKPSGK